MRNCNNLIKSVLNIWFNTLFLENVFKFINVFPTLVFIILLNVMLKQII